MARSYEDETANVVAELQRLVGQYDSRVLATYMLAMSTRLYESLITAGLSDVNDVLHEFHELIDYLENQDFSEKSVSISHEPTKVH